MPPSTPLPRLRTAFLARDFPRGQNPSVDSPPLPVSREPFSVSLPEGRLSAVRLSPAGARPVKAPVVLLHDALGCVTLWRDLPDRLCHELGREVIASDRLGFGASDPRPEAPGPTFLEDEALKFSARYPEAKVVEILRKTWRKMSQQGREEASRLALPEALRSLLARALADG